MARILLVIFFLVFSVRAQEQEEENPALQMKELKTQVFDSLELLQKKELDAESFSLEIEKIRTQFDQYSLLKKRQCSGEFSSVEIEGNVMRETKGKKLSKEEKQACYEQLKTIHISFISKIFEARKSFLKYLYGLQVKGLEKAKEEALSSLEATLRTSKRR